MVILVILFVFSGSLSPFGGDGGTVDVSVQSVDMYVENARYGDDGHLLGNPVLSLSVKNMGIKQFRIDSIEFVQGSQTLLKFSDLCRTVGDPVLLPSEENSLVYERDNRPEGAGFDLTTAGFDKLGEKYSGELIIYISPTLEGRAFSQEKESFDNLSIYIPEP